MPTSQPAQTQDLPALGTAAVPVSTYRVQFHHGFGFAAAAAVVPHLKALGISHLYASPYLRARAGSTHGYDVVDHNMLNPEVGTQAEFEHMCAALKEHGMGQLLDIVPNHMGVFGEGNLWWTDVLEHGTASEHAETFDITWEVPGYQLPGKLLLATLGDHYGVVLEAGDIKLGVEAETGSFFLAYFEGRFPVDPRDYAAILRSAPLPFGPHDTDGSKIGEIEALLEGFGNLPARNDVRASERGARARDARALKQRFAALLDSTPSLGAWIDACQAHLNGTPGDTDSFAELDALVGRQAYRLAYWRTAGDEINYRRFFDITTLAALRAERQDVYEATHRTILRWVAEGRLDGLRIDHPDGLSDPATYLRRLQASHAEMRRKQGKTPEALYVVVEKILGEGERLPEGWAAHGDTGYHYANQVAGVFVDTDAAKRFDRIYEGFIGERADYAEALHAAKRTIMATSLATDLDLLTEALFAIARSSRRTSDYTRHALRAAISALAADFPVYRSYIGAGTHGGTHPELATPPSAADRMHLEYAAAQARKRCRGAEMVAIDYVCRLMLDAHEEPDLERRGALLRFANRWQQFTAPVMAKAMEDTTFYRYLRFASLNDVGGEPARFGLGTSAFHLANHERSERTPHTLLGTSTHDSKRSEDLRARLNVLSEMPDEWQAAVQRWHEMNDAPHDGGEGGDGRRPTRNHEYLIYQSLVGAWPLERLDADALETLRERVQAYVKKSVREAKDVTSWLDPDEAYEAVLERFIDRLFGQDIATAFRPDLERFVEGIAPFGCFNSLGMVALKLTSPGVPDIYQGCEAWNFSLVDPDNRRPIDFESLRVRLAEVQSAFGAHGGARGVVQGVSDLQLASWRADLPGGHLKLLATWRLLQMRTAHPLLFRNGGYREVQAEGPAAAHAIAFLRQHENGRESGDGKAASLTVAGRLLHRLSGGSAEALFGGDAPGDTRADAQGNARGNAWGSTRLVLPEEWAGASWRDVITGRRIAPREGPGGPALMLGDVLAALPCAVLMPE